jgi:hypothetical protein
LLTGLATSVRAADGKARPTLDQMLKETVERQAAHPPPGKGSPRAAQPRPGGKAAPARKPGTPAELRTALVALLQAPGPPPGPGELAALGSGVEDQLIGIGRDDRAELSLRARAVSALARAPFPTTATRLFLTGLLQPRPTPSPPRPDAGAPAAASGKSDVLLVRRALIALGTIGGGRAPDLLAPLLSHADPDVRADAAVALALTRLPRAAEHLRTRLPLETDGRVRGLMARQLNVLDAALGRQAPAQ